MGVIGKDTRSLFVNRLDHFDLISGLFMIQIIIMHILQFVGEYEKNEVFQFIMRLSCFFMPWFYFKSGYFYKHIPSFSRAYLLNKARKLLIPFFVFFLIGCFFTVPVDIYQSQRSLFRILATPGYQLIMNAGGGLGNLPLWFLPSLFFTTIAYCLMDLHKLKWFVPLFPIVGYILFDYNIHLLLGLSNLFLGIFFFATGFYFRKTEDSIKTVYLTFLFIVYILFVLFYPNYLDFRSNKIVFGNYLIYVLQAIIGLIFITKCGVIAGKINFINYIGKNSIIYFVTHWLIIKLVLSCLSILNFGIPNYMKVFLLIISVFGFSPFIVKFINRKYPFLVGA